MRAVKNRVRDGLRGSQYLYYRQTPWNQLFTGWTYTSDASKKISLKHRKAPGQADLGWKQTKDTWLRLRIGQLKDAQYSCLTCRLRPGVSLTRSIPASHESTTGLHIYTQTHTKCTRTSNRPKTWSNTNKKHTHTTIGSLTTTSAHQQVPLKHAVHRKRDAVITRVRPGKLIIPASSSSSYSLFRAGGILLPFLLALARGAGLRQTFGGADERARAAARKETQN